MVTIRLGAQTWNVCWQGQCHGCEDTHHRRTRSWAQEWAAHFRSNPEAISALRRLWGHSERFDVATETDELLLDRIAFLVGAGRLNICNIFRPTVAGTPVEEGASAVPAGAVPVSRSRSEAEAAVPAAAEPPTLSDNIDETLIAAVMKDAARLGIPFCEECLRARVKAA
jgi:hypothetical protein